MAELVDGHAVAGSHFGLAVVQAMLFMLNTVLL